MKVAMPISELQREYGINHLKYFILLIIHLKKEKNNELRRYNVLPSTSNIVDIFIYMFYSNSSFVAY